MVSLLLHKDATFEDEVVYATGHAFVRCAFDRCTVVMAGFPFSFDTCTFDTCVWHLNIVIHDREQLATVRGLLATIEGALPMPDPNS